MFESDIALYSQIFTLTLVSRTRLFERLATCGRGFEVVSSITPILGLLRIQHIGLSRLVRSKGHHKLLMVVASMCQ